jgi:hypothetical protein
MKKKKKLPQHRVRMISSAIAYLRIKGYHEIKATQEGFKEPRAVFLKASEAGFTPDMIAEKDFGTYIFEFVDDQTLEEWDDKLDKWRIFAEYAQRKKGKFYLILYSDNVDVVNKKLESLDFEPGLLKIRK